MGYSMLFRKEGSKPVITDIIDGKNYRRLCEPGQFLNNPAHISFIFNTDGAPLYSWSGVSLWPVFLAINELPSPDRCVHEFIFSYGRCYFNTQWGQFMIIMPIWKSSFDSAQGSMWLKRVQVRGEKTFRNNTTALIETGIRDSNTGKRFFLLGFPRETWCYGAYGRGRENLPLILSLNHLPLRWANFTMKVSAVMWIII